VLNNGNLVLVKHWVRTFGGKNKRPAGHALKTLGECIELAFAAGASMKEVLATCAAEIEKAEKKGEITCKFNRDQFREEMADVLILLAVLALHNDINTDREVTEKIATLMSRTWEVDPDGVLRRPGRLNS